MIGKGQTLNGKKVIIFLRTPLFRFKYLVDGKERQIIDNAIRLEAKILEERDLGVIVEVKDLSNQKEQQTDLPFETMFLPFSKMDFMIFV